MTNNQQLFVNQPRDTNEPHFHRLTANKRPLTKREIACLYWAALGLTSQRTALLLEIKKSTVETHRKQLKRKLGCSTLAHAVFEGLRLGLINFHQQ